VDPALRKQCLKETKRQLREALGECRDRYEARQDLCRDLKEWRYRPVIDPENFLIPPYKDEEQNPYFPLIQGTTYVYEGPNDEGELEHTEVTVTDQTREIMGVTCVVVRDTVSMDGEVIEDTYDWYALDKDGNVWYFGEESKEYEDGVLVSIEGSWMAGVDGALPGIIMKAVSQPEDLYRQEYALGEAEDVAEVLAVGVDVTLPNETEYNGCVQTRDFSPMEPDVEEHKYYAPGIGVVYERTVEGGTGWTQLIGVTTPP
jgi:hypothetical protein